MLQLPKNINTFFNNLFGRQDLTKPEVEDKPPEKVFRYHDDTTVEYWLERGAADVMSAQYMADIQQRQKEVKEAPRYYTTEETIETEPGYGNKLAVTIWEETKDEQDNVQVREIGKYERNYSAMYHTFCPFSKGEKWFALYSTDYTATRVMSLPDCTDLCGEEPASHGFCPVDYYVPNQVELEDAPHLAGTLGFVAGCVWGDDSSWKIQYLDLSEVEIGKITRSQRFGYVQMPPNIDRLKDCIDVSFMDEKDKIIEISCTAEFDINEDRSN